MFDPEMLDFELFELAVYDFEMFESAVSDLEMFDPEKAIKQVLNHGI